MHKYAHDLAEQINPHEAARLISLFRLPDESTFLQTFKDGPDELYWLDSWKDRSGKPRKTQMYALAKAGGKGRTSGPTATGSSFTLEEIGAGQYTRQGLARVGVFWTVNVLKPEATRRQAHEVARVAAVFVDLDGAPLPSGGFHLPPTAVVESSPGRYHAYWAVADLPLDEFGTAQKHLAGLYGGDTSVHDLPRVMRLPGYWHGKKEPGFLTRILETRPDAQYSRADLLGNFPGLSDALAAAQAEREHQQQDAAERRAEADRLCGEIRSGTAGTRAEVQRKYGEITLLNVCADVLGTGEGSRNKALNWAAFRAGQMVGGGFLDEDRARAELSAVGQRVGLEGHEVERTVSSGLEAGKGKPVDPSRVAQFVGVKKGGKKPSGNLRQAAARVEQSASDLPSAEELPDPEGEGGTYSSAQVRELLGITWPVVAADTDNAHAHRLRELAGDDLEYVAEFGGYVAWNGKQWLSGGKDGAGQVEARRRVQGLGVAMGREVERLLSLYSRLDVAAKRLAQEHGPDSREVKVMRRRAEAMEKAYYAHARAAKATESDSRQRAILSAAQTLSIQSIRNFEPRPWLVGFENGVWAQGEFREARREDHMLTLAAVAYQPGADRGEWLEVLDRITGGDADLALTLQDVAGYALSGAASLRLLPWLYGEGGTGKSTFAELLATVLGDMAATISPKHLATDADRERLGAVIWGKRVALCAEAGNARLDAESLKTLSGGDRLAVRRLYAESFTGRASHVLLMVANDAPRVEAYDDALKDRVLALPFSHPLRGGGPLLGGRRLEELRQDPSSALVLGFASWAVEGLGRVHRAGDVHRAVVCRAATRAFWGDVDPLRDFWATLDPAELVQGVGVTAFRREYESWCESVGTRPLGAQKFNRACRSVGLDSHSNGKVKGWKLTKPSAFPSVADQPGASGVNRN
ncbi:phage/plasmid primase, P4 family [Deinococcus sp. YIM 134068]|uniref:phage/plasmid primase, P4 family n=1 Tax=Deinococcus lichenicola TaxID=3118910 RepID=UPI002F936EB5